MGPRSLSALHRLQEVETHLRSLKERLRRKEKQLEQHAGRVQQLEEQLTAKKDDVKHKQSRTNHLELEFKARETTVTRLRGQLNSAKSNKEYSVILTQLNTERAENSKLEERILKDLTAIDEMKKALEDLAKQIEDLQGQYAQHDAEFQGERQELQTQIDQLEQQREAVAQEVPPQDLMIFQRVAERLDGEAMARIQELSPGEFGCNGCNMSIPVETVNALLTRDEIQMCHICGRILYLEDEVKSEKK